MALLASASCGGGGDSSSGTATSPGLGVGGGQGAGVAATTDGSGADTDAEPTLAVATPEGWTVAVGPGFEISLPPGWSLDGAMASGMTDDGLVTLAVAQAGPVAASIVADSLVESFEQQTLALLQTPLRLDNGTGIRLAVVFRSGLTGYSYVIDTGDITMTVSVSPVDGGADPDLIDAIAGSVIAVG